MIVDATVEYESATNPVAVLDVVLVIVGIESLLVGCTIDPMEVVLALVITVILVTADVLVVVEVIEARASEEETIWHAWKASNSISSQT